MCSRHVRFAVSDACCHIQEADISLALVFEDFQSMSATSSTFMPFNISYIALPKLSAVVHSVQLVTLAVCVQNTSVQGGRSSPDGGFTSESSISGHHGSYEEARDHKIMKETDRMKPIE